jgi:hypothetical protein
MIPFRFYVKKSLSIAAAGQRFGWVSGGPSNRRPVLRRAGQEIAERDQLILGGRRQKRGSGKVASSGQMR